MVLDSGKKAIYIATGRAFDDEMSERIETHQDRRGSIWETIEEPLALTDALRQSSLPNRMIMVDCLTLWITNLMMADANVEREAAQLVAYLAEAETPVVLVSNETGLGVVPADEMSRRFNDLAGSVHQEVARVASAAYLITAGLPLKLK